MASLRSLLVSDNVGNRIYKIIVINSPISEMRDENGFTIIGASDFMLRFIK